MCFARLCVTGIIRFAEVRPPRTAKETRKVLYDSEAELILKNMKPLLKKGDVPGTLLDNEGKSARREYAHRANVIGLSSQ